MGQAGRTEGRPGQDQLGAGQNVSRLQGQTGDCAGLQAIFRADVSKLPAYTGVELPNNGGYALYKILAVKPLATVDADKRRVLQRDYENMTAQEDFTAYLTVLRQRYRSRSTRRSSKIRNAEPYPFSAKKNADHSGRRFAAGGRKSGRHRVGVAERRGVQTAVDIHDLAGDAAGEVRKHEGGGIADFVDGHVAAQRRVVRCRPAACRSCRCRRPPAS